MRGLAYGSVLDTHAFMLEFIVNKRREGDKTAKPKGFWVNRVELTCQHANGELQQQMQERPLISAQ